MKKICFLLICVLPVLAKAQNTIVLTIKDSASGDALSNVSVLFSKNKKGTTTDSTGKVMIPKPVSTTTLTLSAVGYQQKMVTLDTAATDTTILLRAATQALEEVIISSSRTESRIENLPTRVEVLGAEEVEEESGIKPGNI
ncbi:MAG: carboxypeptidase-like regulatory domain-containing protein, partial [Bacteroidota bacterium]|nr:carboxypeptidase-like regulatory domain-containing protein [Bacteroidota bacterium]